MAKSHEWDPVRTLKGRRDAELLQVTQFCVNSYNNPCNLMAAWIVTN